MDDTKLKELKFQGPRDQWWVPVNLRDPQTTTKFFYLSDDFISQEKHDSIKLDTSFSAGRTGRLNPLKPSGYYMYRQV
jgi:hypothetical protein